MKTSVSGDVWMENFIAINIVVKWVHKYLNSWINVLENLLTFIPHIYQSEFHMDLSIGHQPFRLDGPQVIHGPSVGDAWIKELNVKI